MPFRPLRPFELLSTQRWVWRALVRSALIPLLLVETLLVAVYLFSSQHIRDANVELLRRQADEQLANTARLEVNVIDEQLHAVSALADIYRQATWRALEAPLPMQPGQEYARNAAGVLYSPRNDGRAASFYSAITPPEQQDLDKVRRLESLDPLMQSLLRANPLVNAVYFNSRDSYNRIYPWFDTPSQYPPRMNIPEYSFYYAADAEHNPSRDVVWTDVYVDPAGLGWMTSAVAPVYRGDVLEGVVGLDITVASIVEQILQLEIPWQGYAVLVNRQGTLMALPPRAEADFGLQELTRFSYREAIEQESFKPERFNIARRADTAELARMMRAAADGGGVLVLNGGRKRVAWREIDATGWQLLTLVDEEAVYGSTERLADHFRNIGYLLIAGLLLFYLLFFAYTWRRSVWLSRSISAPLETLNHILIEIGHEYYDQPRPRFRLQELQRSADAVIRMGRDLGRANRAKNRFLSSISHELRTPLSSIIGFAELVRASPSLGEDEQACIDEILQASQHLLHLINDVLDLAQVQSDRVHLQRVAVPLSDAVDSCLRMIEPQAQAQQVALCRFEQGRELIVQADAGRLNQVLLNLLSNAVKYNRAGGVVQVEASAAAGRVRISVSDTGAGIAPERQPELFLPFSRLGHETGTIPGTGIGLNISKHLVELMEGRIGCDSQPGHGSRFWIELAQAGQDD
ncbi:sensor histidine kinase [Marinobacterium weihaiense]|uniref:histidine kinase n=1 Tax=Marinobacterium weihaiense TaxID=2851016 RepID=A0ABS6MAY7_9GAMM|nr:ATP-binding protein [Marinobacterium weihaiense]MBV0933471.1 hypothetical protein [Marinobacterium weihaiense]